MIMRRLISPGDKRTIFRSLRASYFSPDSQVIEVSEGKVLAFSRTTDSQDMWTSYVQLWAFCMRNFPSMTTLEPRKELGRDKPSSTPNAALWHHLGDLAVKLGFRTEQALKFQRQNPYAALAQQVMHSVHPGHIPDETIVSQIARFLELNTRNPPRTDAVALTSSASLPVERRCGRPFEDDFVSDRSFLFIPTVYETRPSSGPEIGSFYVKRDLFLSFFGDRYVSVGTCFHDILAALTNHYQDREQSQLPVEVRSQYTPERTPPLTERACRGTCDAARAAQEESRSSAGRIIDLEGQINTLEDNSRQLHQVRQQFSEKSQECRDLLSKIRQFEESVQSEKEQQAQLTEKIQEQEAKIQELNRSLKSVEEVHAQCLESQREHQNRSDQLQARLTTQETDLSNAIEARDKLSAAMKNQDECSRMLEDAQRERDGLSRELASLRVRNTQLDEEAKAKSRDISDLEEKIKHLKETDAQASRAHLAIKQNLDNLTQMNQDLTEEKVKLLHDLEDVRRQLSERTNELQEADEQRNKLEVLFKSSEIKEMSETIRSLKKDKAELQKRIGNFEAQKSQEVSTLRRRLTEASGHPDPRYQDLYILARRADHKAAVYPYCFTIVMGPDKRPIHIRLENHPQHLHETLGEIITTITAIEQESKSDWSIYALEEGRHPRKLPSTDNIAEVLRKCKNVYAGSQRNMNVWYEAQTISLENKGKKKRLNNDV